MGVITLYIISYIETSLKKKLKNENKRKKRHYTQRGKHKQDHKDPYKVLPKKIVKRKKAVNDTIISAYMYRNSKTCMILPVTKCMGTPCQLMFFAKDLSEFVSKSF